MNRRVPNQHGDGGNQFEINERFDAEPPDFFQIRVPGDADNEDAEKEWRDNHFDKTEKNRAEQLQIYSDGGSVVAKFRAGEESDKNPSRQRAPRSGIRRDKKNRQPTQERWEQRRERQNVSAGEERCRDGNRCGGDGRGKKFVFHRRSMRVSIGAERYAGQRCMSMASTGKFISQSSRKEMAALPFAVDATPRA